MRESTKKQLDLQEILFSRMVVRSEFVLQQHLGHAVQAAAADLEKANITRAEAIALLDYDKREMMPNNSLLYKVDKYDKVSPPKNLYLFSHLTHVCTCELYICQPTLLPLEMITLNCIVMGAADAVCALMLLSWSGHKIGRHCDHAATLTASASQYLLSNGVVRRFTHTSATHAAYMVAF